MFDPVKSILKSIAADPNVSPEFAKIVDPETGETMLNQAHGSAQAHAFWFKTRTVIFVDPDTGNPQWMTESQFDKSGYEVEPLAVYDRDGNQMW